MGTRIPSERSTAARRPPRQFARLWWAALGFAATAGAEVVPLIYVDSQSHSEPMPLQAAFSDWDGPFRPGERQWTFNWAEVGVRGDNWSFALLSRLDYDIRYSKDTSELYYQLNHGGRLAPGKQYDVDLTINSFIATGLRAAWYSGGDSALQTSLGLSVFTARGLQEGNLHGTAQALTSRDYQYAAEVDYFYGEDKLFRRPVDAPGGLGFSLDAGLKWQPSESLRLTAKVVDLVGLIRWTDAPFTRATAVSANSTTDAQGNVHVTPALSGVEGTESSHVQHLDPRVAVEAEVFPDGKLSPVISYRYQGGEHLPGVGARTHFGRQTLGVHLWPTVDAVGVEYGVGRFRGNIAMDNVRTDEARTLWVSMSYGVDL